MKVARRVAAGDAEVTVNATPNSTPAQNIKNITVTGSSPVSSVTMDFAGVPGFTCTVPYTLTLTPPAWVNIGTATADAFGNAHVADAPPQSPTGSGFYQPVSLRN